MSRRRHTPEQIIRKLREGERLLGENFTIEDVCKHLEISDATWHRRQNQYGGMKSEDAKRLKELERENARLKRMVADQALDIDMLKELNPGKLLSPDRRRRAVQVLRDRFGVCERRACRVAGQPRSTQRRRPTVAETERLPTGRLREISRAHPRWGRRKAHALCRAEGLVVNRKRTRRLWREHGLKRPVRVRKKRRIGAGRHQRLRASRPDRMWALDFQVDVTADGRQVRFLNIVDEFTREALAVTAFRSCTADQLVAVLDELVAATGRKPEHIRMDNGTEMTAHAMTDWCRFTGVDPAFIDPASPWQNGICESFNGRFRDEFLTCEQFRSLTEAQVLAEDWRIEYNTYRPHGSLGFLTPEAFRQQWTPTEFNQPQLA
ncbi:IS3 family transposase [Nocardia paucivorans]|uniref:IS3 family transposase n=1 Tax=Nocardia paucivorans TaxID=114259 RepID=UPI001FDEDDB6|nr:IS3 family transposase [Nocardia paucivorans]